MNTALENFGAGLKTMDISLYAGVAIVVYVLFKEQINNAFGKIAEKIKTVKAPEFPVDTGLFIDNEPVTQDDIFFDLIKSWKQTRDLAEAYGADKAVDIADQMFPHLVPKDDHHEIE